MATSPLPPPPDFTSSRAARIRHTIATTLRPWPTFFNLSSLSPPLSLSESTYRFTNNLHYFRLNYTLISLLILFLSLLYHPISIIVFLLTLLGWLFLYNEPLTIFGRDIDDRLVLILLGFFTLFALIWTNVWWNIFVSVLISGFLICLHSVLRFPEDVDDQESPYGALLSVVDDSPRGPYSQLQELAKQSAFAHLQLELGISSS